MDKRKFERAVKAVVKLTALCRKLHRAFALPDRHPCKDSLAAAQGAAWESEDAWLAVRRAMGLPDQPPTPQTPPTDDTPNPQEPTRTLSRDEYPATLPDEWPHLDAFLACAYTAKKAFRKMIREREPKAGLFAKDELANEAWVYVHDRLSGEPSERRVRKTARRRIRRYVRENTMACTLRIGSNALAALAEEQAETEAATALPVSWVLPGPQDVYELDFEDVTANVDWSGIDEWAQKANYEAAKVRVLQWCEAEEARKPWRAFCVLAVVPVLDGLPSHTFKEAARLCLTEYGVPVKPDEVRDIVAQMFRETDPQNYYGSPEAWTQHDKRWATMHA